MIVKDFMTTEIFCVTRETPIGDVAKMLNQKKIHAVPVVKDKNKLIGIITETDFFTKNSSSIYLPLYVEFLKKTEADNKIKVKNEEVEELVNAAAKDVMTTDCITINENAEINELIKLVKEKRLHTIPVTNDNKELVGIVALSDLMQLLN